MRQAEQQQTAFRLLGGKEEEEESGVLKAAGEKRKADGKGWMLTPEAGHRGDQRLESGGSGVAARHHGGPVHTSVRQSWTGPCLFKADRGDVCRDVCVCVCVCLGTYVFGPSYFLLTLGKGGGGSLLTPSCLSPLPDVHWHCGIRGPVRNTHLHTPHLCETERVACSPPCVVLLSSSGMRGEGSADCVAIACLSDNAYIAFASSSLVL